MKVLLVEDDLELLGLYEGLLVSYGYKVTVVSELALAKMQIQEAQFDLYILDLHLKNDFALSLVPLIRRLNPRGKVVVSSGNISEEIKKTEGVWRFCQKPYNFHELLKSLDLEFYKNEVGIDDLFKLFDMVPNPISLVDMEQEDQPLIYVNESFCQMTGYLKEEVLGKNCRFLQGRDTDVNDVKKVRDAIRQKQALFCDLLNYKKNEEPFYNRLILVPIAFQERSLYLGVQLSINVEKKVSLSAFEKYKKMESIRDKVNTPLMKIYTVLADKENIEKKTRQRIVESSFGEIIDFVKTS